MAVLSAIAALFFVAVAAVVMGVVRESPRHDPVTMLEEAMVGAAGHR